MVTDELKNTYAQYRRYAARHARAIINHAVKDDCYIGPYEANTAWRALKDARCMIKNGNAPKYGYSAIWSNRYYYWNRIADDGLAWIEKPAECGLRFIGYADELCESINHKGWFAEDDGWSGETYRGAVFQRAAIDGKPIFIAGYEDPCNPGTFRLAIRPRDWFISTEIWNDVTDHDACRDAARMADEHARVDAEESRDYYRANDYGRQSAEKLHELNETMREAIQMIRDACESAPCAASNRLFEMAQDSIAEYRENKSEVWKWIEGNKPSYDANLCQAWQEGFKNACI